MAVPVEPVAFMSYARFDDQHHDGLLSQFRERLAAEVRAQTGQEFAIFQDRSDIAWGQNWQERIDEALDAVTLLLVIITPRLFRSTPCRAEFERFLNRERELARTDLILPVYYIGAREMDDPAVRATDEMATTLASRQLADWRELRFEPFTSPLVLKSVAQLASRMRDTFWHAPTAPARAVGRVRPTEASAGTSDQAGATSRVTAKTEPPTHVVDAFPGRGSFTTVGSAIEAAQPGDRILVRPGLYDEALVLDKPLEILGDGPVSDIQIRSRNTTVLSFRAAIGRVANLTLRQAGGGGNSYGVDISQGRLDLEGCDISSQSLACVAIHDGADPRLRRNKIHNGNQVGVLVYDGGLGTLEDNDITGNTFAGVEIGTGGDPTVRRNHIHGGKAGGVFVWDNGLGTLEDNDITGNTYAGVEIRAGGNPTLRRNQIHDGEQGGVYVLDNGLGTLEDNDITGNIHAGVLITTGGNPVVRGNRINRNGNRAVRIIDGGRGVVENNDLTGNEKGAFDIAEDCEDTVIRARNTE
jgi:parallel beta-helix repeat protein